MATESHDNKRIIGEHFKHNGKPKRRFTKDGALKFARANAGQFHVYECSFCGGWHLASAKER